MLIIEQKLSNVEDPNFRDIILTEAVVKLGLSKHFDSKILRRRVQEDCDGKAFLDSKNLKFPIVNPKTCDVDCKVLMASYYALQKVPKASGVLDMLQEARDLMHKHGCSRNIRVKFENLEMDLDTLLFYID